MCKNYGPGSFATSSRPDMIVISLLKQNGLAFEPVIMVMHQDGSASEQPRARPASRNRARDQNSILAVVCSHPDSNFWDSCEKNSAKDSRRLAPAFCHHCGEWKRFRRRVVTHKRRSGVGRNTQSRTSGREANLSMERLDSPWRGWPVIESDREPGAPAAGSARLIRYLIHFGAVPRID